MKITTCEGDIHEINNPHNLKVEVPLKMIKSYEWSESLKRKIPIHFREVFQLETDVFYWDEDTYHVFNRWVSKKVY